MNTHRSLVAWALALALIVPATSLLGARPARADQPNTMSYQGRLKDTDGVVVDDGDYDFEFRLYDDIAGGAMLWEEAQPDVTVTDGYFAVSLGEVDGFFDGVGEDFDFSQPAYLSVEVNGDDEMTPRVAANSVAYAYVSRGLESYTSEVAAEAAADPYAGRMYYNTTDGNVYTYDGVEAEWVNLSSPTTTLDEAYNNFGATASKITLDAAQGQTGGLEFESGMAGDIIFDLQSTGDVSFQNNGVEFASFNDNGSMNLGGGLSTVFVDGTNFRVNTQGEMTLVSDGSDNVAIDISDVGFATALSIGDSGISGTTAAIDLTNFDVATDGNITVSAGMGLDTNAAGTLVLGGVNATQLTLCNSAACDTINLGTNVDADAINIGENNDTLTINTAEFDVSSATGGITIDDDGDAAVISIDGSTWSRDLIQFATTAEIHSGVNAGLTIWGGDNGADLNEDVEIVSEDWNVDTNGTVNASGLGLIGAGVLFWQDNLESISNATDQAFSFVSSDAAGDITLVAENTDGDANMILAAQGAGTAVVDSTGAGSVLIAQNATTVTVCSSAACDAVNIATNADADVINVGDDLDSLEIEALTDFNSAVNFASGGATFSSGEFLFSAGNVQLNDNVVLQLGSGAEFEMVHDGANTSFANTTGNLTFSNSNGSLTLDSTAAGDVIMMDLSAGGTFLVEAELGTDLFRVNDDETGVEIPVGDLSFSDGFLVGSNSERIEVGVVDSSFVLGRNDAGTVNLTVEDNDADANFAIIAGGSGSLSLTGGTGSLINFSEFDVDAGTGGVTVNDGLDLGAFVVEGTNLDIDSLDFVGAGTVQSQVGTDLFITAADDLILTGTDGVSIVGASTQLSGDLTVFGGDISGVNMSGTSIDLGEDVAGAISFNAGAGNLIFNTDADSSMLFDSTLDATDNDITTGTDENLRVSPNGTGDIVFVTDADSTVQLTGTADGTASMVLSLGDLVLSNGGIQLLAGDFDVMLDADDEASITNPDMNASGNALEISAITDASNAGNANGLNVVTNFGDYGGGVDDGEIDNRVGVSINVSNDYDESAAGLGDNIAGLFVGPLTGLIGDTAQGVDSAIRTGSGWDMDLYLANGETISNQADDTIVLNGTGGGTNTSLTIDLDGFAATVPTIVGGASDLVAINDSLSVGVDGDTAHAISVADFSIAGANDLYVADDVGINGDTYFDGTVSYGSVIELAAVANPSVAAGSHFRTSGAGATITDFTGGHTGQLIFIRASNGSTTLDCTASSLVCGSVDIPLNNNDFVMFFKNDMNVWDLVTYNDSAADHSNGDGFDLAEWFPSSQELVPGEVVSVDASGPGYVKASESAYDSTVLGIVSTEPGITLGEPADVSAAKIALAGRVPVNVNNENGAIVPGDYLTTSSTPGEAMKATEAGPVIGVALDSFDGTSGQVLVKVSNFWYTPSASGANSLQDAAGTEGLEGAEVVVEGDAIFTGSVTVRDHLYASSDTAGRARIVAGDTKVHVAFETSYEQQPIVTATLRTATDIPGYWWVENESTAGFDLSLDGTLTTDVEFNWMALGVENGKVTVSDGSTEDINVYVLSEGELAPSSSSSSSSSGSDETVSDESSEESSEPVAEDTTEVLVEEPVIEPSTESEPEPTLVAEPSLEPVVEEVVVE